MEAKHVFKYDISLKNDFDSSIRCIYTNIDFCEKYKEKNSSEIDEWDNMRLVEDEIEKIIYISADTAESIAKDLLSSNIDTIFSVHYAIEEFFCAE